MTNLAEQFAQKIEQGQMPKPIPKWRVQAKHACLWLIFGSFVATGIISSGVSVWFVSDPQGLVAEYKDGSFVSQFLDALPLFWILLSLGMGVAALAVFVHAPRGYRYRTAAIGGALVLAFIALGGAVSATGLSEKIEFLAARKLPGYYLIQRPRMNNFLRPENGMMVGHVLGTENMQVRIRDPRGVVWHVDVSKCDAKRTNVIIERSPCVRVIGSASTSQYYFEAADIKPCPRGIRMPQM